MQDCLQTLVLVALEVVNIERKEHPAPLMAAMIRHRRDPLNVRKDLLHRLLVIGLVAHTLMINHHAGRMIPLRLLRLLHRPFMNA